MKTTNSNPWCERQPDSAILHRTIVMIGQLPRGRTHHGNPHPFCLAQDAGRERIEEDGGVQIVNENPKTPESGGGKAAKNK
jgi:hypothetical protein